MKIRGFLVHCCALDTYCWKMMWQYGAPMRMHLGERWWDIPILTTIAERRSRKIWSDAVVLKRNPFAREEEEGSEDEP